MTNNYETGQKNGIIVALLVIAGVLLFFVWQAQAVSPAGIMTADEIKGRIEVLEKTTSFIAVGDVVLVVMNKPVLLMRGDRLEIYDPDNTGKTDSRKQKILKHVGRLVVIEVGNGRIVGKVEFAKQEIASESYVDFSIPEKIQTDAYTPHLKALADKLLEKNGSGVIKIAFPDVTDASGDVTRLGDAIYENISASICGRKQFSCVDRGELASVMRGYGLATSASAGKYFMKKINKEFDADLFVSAVAVPNPAGDGSATVTVKMFGAGDGVKKLEFALTEKAAVAESPEEMAQVVAKNDGAGLGFLRLSLANTDALNGKQVDNLFVEPLDSHIAAQYMKIISDIVPNVTLAVDDKPLTNKDKASANLYYSDILSAGNHRLTVTVAPSLPSRGIADLTYGKKIVKTMPFVVKADGAVQTDVYVRIFNKQVIIAVDNNPLVDNANVVPAVR
ncbi:MAG: hypothetical protein HY280_06300 [Nitrospinae bacterium]|nr:hypothetical protein [Nitrospinota bacterium]